MLLMWFRYCTVVCCRVAAVSSWVECFEDSCCIFSMTGKSAVPSMCFKSMSGATSMSLSIYKSWNIIDQRKIIKFTVFFSFFLSSTFLSIAGLLCANFSSIFNVFCRCFDSETWDLTAKQSYQFTPNKSLKTYISNLSTDCFERRKLTMASEHEKNKQYAIKNKMKLTKFGCMFCLENCSIFLPPTHVTK